MSRVRNSRTLAHMGILLMVLGVALAPASAQSLKERRALQSRQAALENEVEYTNEVCGTNIDADVVWPSIEHLQNSDATQDLQSCDAALSAIESFCADKISQEEIQKKLDQVICTRGENREVELKQGTLMFQADGPGMDDFSYVREYLKNAFAADSKD